MLLQDGKTYRSGGGSLVKITKKPWDCWFIGECVNQDGVNVFMGWYSETGVSQGGEPSLANLVEEVEV